MTATGGGNPQAANAVVAATAPRYGLPALGVAAPRYCDRFGGGLVYARGWSVALEFDQGWAPTTGWLTHRKIRAAWRHPAHRRAVVWTPTPTTTWVLLRSTLAPELDEVRRCAEFALGAAAVPVRETVMPTALRLPLRVHTGGLLSVPQGRTRCFRVWPQGAPLVRRLQGHEVEFRVNLTRDRSTIAYHAEAVLGTAHQARDGRSRSLFFPADARSAPGITDPGAMKKFLARALLELTHFADRCDDVGLEVDRWRAQQLATVAEIGVTAEDDVSFEVSVPMATADLEFNV